MIRRHLHSATMLVKVGSYNSSINLTSLGRPDALADTGYCPDGFYPSFKDCDAYYLCWDAGNWGDKVFYTKKLN